MSTFVTLSAIERQGLMSRMDEVMSVEFGLTSEARQSFWETVSAGVACLKAC